ncbi:DUF2512 family protein [Planococcus lenghuensis]|uniref:DUF2512 family protein n=1 Tax=Planococcus lenghuensis TaxID=2213202 RepID=UPI001E477071|nr:DUF2512 family protein [Planococcus lenghuensis]
MKALLLKFIMVAIVLSVVLTWLFEVEWDATLWLSALLTLLAYIVGDLMIFGHAGAKADHKRRNLIATVSDLLFAFVLIWWLGIVMVEPEVDLLLAALVASVVLAIGEWFYHMYIDRKVLTERISHGNPQGES